MSVERTALAWMAARIVREKLQRQRNELVCAHEYPMPDEDAEAGVYCQPRNDGRDGRACWKVTYKETSDRTDWETGEHLDMAWVPHRPPAEWCENCKARQELHGKMRAAVHREGSLRAALTRVCRAALAVKDGGKDRT